MPTAPDILRIVRATRTSGRGGYPSVWTVYEIHECVPGGGFTPLLRKSGDPREWQSRKGARSALRRLRAAAAAPTYKVGARVILNPVDYPRHAGRVGTITRPHPRGVPGEWGVEFRGREHPYPVNEASMTAAAD